MKRHPLLALLLVGTAQTAAAAPLDALLSANKLTTRGMVKIEAGYDLVNDTVDVFNIRESSDDFAGTNVGDYSGAHVLAGIAVTPDLWLDGGLWRRKIEYRNDDAKVDTWQVAAQYRLFEAQGYRPITAVRVGAWGNSASSLTKSSPTRFSGLAVNSATVKSPEDRQFQVDLIATWPLSKSMEFSTFAGVGTSKVSIGSVSGSVNYAGCNYNVSFGRASTTGTAIPPCAGLTRFNFNNDALGVNVYDEAEYKARFAHLGFSGKWTSGPWELRAGYQYQLQRRDNIDDLIESRGGSATKSNHIVVGEVVYWVTDRWGIFGRGQYMNSQFSGEIPFAYNTLTAHRFDERYGIATVGVMMEF